MAEDWGNDFFEDLYAQENAKKELMPCPFCGEADDLGDYRDSYPHPEVVCGNCGAHAHGDMWNKRCVPNNEES